MVKLQQQYQIMFDYMAQGAFFQRADGTLVDVNPAALEMFGLDRDQFLGRTSYTAEWRVIREDGTPLSPDQHPSMLALLTGQQVRDFVLAVYNPQKKYFVWMSVNAIPMFEVEGELPTQVFVTLHDITKQRQTEEQLRLINDSFIHFGPNFTSNINCLTEAVGRIMGAACALYNRLGDGLLCSVGQWQSPPGYQAEDSPEGHICYDVICRAGRTPLVITDLDKSPYANTDPNVSRYSLKTYVGIPVFWGEEAVGSLCAVFVENHLPTAAELSFMTIVAAALGVEEARWRAEEELLEGEERFRMLVESAPEAIFIHKGEQFLYLNHSMRQLIGCGPDDNLVGQSCFERLSPEYLATAQERITNSSTLRKPSPLREMEFFCLDHSRVPVEVTSVPFRFRGDDAIVVFVRDITERKLTEKKILQLNSKLEERVIQRTTELERLNTELEGFCYAISHEFRAPLARMEGFCELLSELAAKADRDGLIHCADRILAATLRLKTVIDSLLTMNRLVRADMAIDRVNLSQVVRQIVDQLLEEQKDRSIRVTIMPDITVSGERSLLEICLRNLLENAVKYTARTPSAVIEFGATTRAGQTFYYVRDNGVGFDMQYAKNLFQPFCRLHTEAEFEGTGVGLATVQRIIEKHGGRIWAEAVPGRGTTFYFTLGLEGGAGNDEKPVGAADRRQLR